MNILFAVLTVTPVVGLLNLVWLVWFRKHVKYRYFLSASIFILVFTAYQAIQSYGYRGTVNSSASTPDYVEYSPELKPVNIKEFVEEEVDKTIFSEKLKETSH